MSPKAYRRVTVLFLLLVFLLGCAVAAEAEHEGGLQDHDQSDKEATPNGELPLNRLTQPAPRSMRRTRSSSNSSQATTNTSAPRAHRRALATRSAGGKM